MMEAAFEQAAAALEPRARLAKVNTDEEQGLGSRFSIKGIPTVIIFKEGREVERRSGAMDYGTLVGWIEGHL
jgi:thioredoxin 2